MSILNIQRYPQASDPSLKAWNAADELMIHVSREYELDNIIIIHDLFGYLSCQLNDHQPQTVITFASQQNAVQKNAEHNHLMNIKQQMLLDDLDTAKCALLKIPKSLDLFRLYLSILSRSIDKNGTLFCGFMTRNFTNGWIKIAEEYFSEINQSKAHKKARIMILKGPKLKVENLVQEYNDENSQLWKQYLGVFSAGRIDYASQFLMDNIILPEGKFVAVDVGSGNGVLGKFIHNNAPEAEVHLTDDNLLAVRSCEMNVFGSNVKHHFSRNLDFLSDGPCDLVVSNPPFHFEYEINMDVAFQIFEDAFRVLKKGGDLWVVANNNLPYKPELLKHFHKCEVFAQNNKFIIYRCRKLN
ncbi:MAG: methyltransferase [Crocinitomicaceae bacterium]|nr:methyltransferase [Crocinitomicaceae bacterium]